MIDLHCPRTCSIDGCSAPAYCRGWCVKHYSRWRNHGDPTRGPLTVTERFSRRVIITPGCWLWTGTTSNSGYATISVGGRLLYAHRVSYEQHVGPIPEGLELDHLCHTRDVECPGGIDCPHRSCVNPAHLEPVTPRTNTLRGTSPAAQQARRTHCVNGHEFTPENTYRPPSRPNVRQCRACSRARSNRYYAERTA